MCEDGIEVWDRVIDRDEYVGCLKSKLVEEVKEVLSCTNREELCEELADLLEVMLALGEVMGVGLDEIMDTARAKRSEKGGFGERCFCDFVEIGSGHPSLDYYKRHPGKYPELKA